MSLANLHWYGWICLCMAISVFMSNLDDALSRDPEKTEGTGVRNSWLVSAVLITLTLFLLLDPVVP